VGNLESRPYSNTIVEGNEALADSTTPPPKAGGQEEGEETAAESKDDTEVEPNKAEDIQDDGEFEGFVFEAEEPDKKKKEKVELQDAPEELVGSWLRIARLTTFTWKFAIRSINTGWFSSESSDHKRM